MPDDDYDDDRIQALLSAIDAGQAVVTDMLSVVLRTRELFVPDVADSTSRFLAVDRPYYGARRGSEDAVEASFRSLRVDAAPAVSGFASIVAARAGIEQSFAEPYEMDNIGGDAFTLVKNWSFGTSGNITNYDDLDEEFNYADVFGTINNGGNYGTNTVASKPETAISGQPVDYGTPFRFREFTANSMLAYVKPWADGQPLGPASAFNGGNGSIFAKFQYPSGGSRLGKTIVWETRFRMPNPVAGAWFALWTTAQNWNMGAEFDLIEAFSAYPEYVAEAWHSNAVHPEAVEDINYWPNWSVGQDEAEFPVELRSLDLWHVVTWVYHADDSFEAYMDGSLIQSGSMPWTVGDGDDAGESTNMAFHFDFSALHNNVGDANFVNLVIPWGSPLPVYEIAYSNIFEREPA